MSARRWSHNEAKEEKGRGGKKIRNVDKLRKYFKKLWCSEVRRLTRGMLGQKAVVERSEAQLQEPRFPSSLI